MPSIPSPAKTPAAIQSAVALAVATGVNIRVETGSESDSSLAGQPILADPANDGGLVVVFWEHRRLPLLASGLGWPAMPAMDDDNFDALDLLRYDTGSNAPSELRFSQAQLLESRQSCPVLISAPLSPVR